MMYNGMQNPMLNMFGNYMNFQNQFNAFRQQVMSQGINPQMQVQQMLMSGQMTQDQFNQLRMMANMITGRRN